MLEEKDFERINKGLGETIEQNILPAVGEMINKAKQDMMDYTDKRIGESEGKIIPKLKTLVDVLENKKIISAKEAHETMRVGTE